MLSRPGVLTKNSPQISRIHTEAEKQFQCQWFIEPSPSQGDMTKLSAECTGFIT